MKRWAIVLMLLIAAHVVGSYGAEFWDSFAKYGLEVPFSSRLDAPIRVLPWLLKTTVARPNVDVIPFWIGYLFPASVLIGAFILRSTFKKRREARGFEVGSS